MNPRRLQLLCDALVDDRIDSAQIDELQKILAGSIEMRREYVRIMGISSSLHLCAAEQDLPQIQTPLQDARGAVAAERTDSPSTSLAFWQRPQFAAAAAVALLTAGVATYTFRARAIDEIATPSPQTPKPLAAPTATLADASTPDWRVGDDRGERITIPLGDSFPSGRVHLASGLAQLNFETGAKVLMQAPASFEVLSDHSLRLFSGKMAADLSEGANGFITALPNGDLVDLGTGFGIELDGDQRSEVHTLAGKVALNLLDGSLELVQSDAARVTATTSSPDQAESVPFDASRWPTGVNSPGGSAKYVFFDSFDSDANAVPLGSTAWEDVKTNSPFYEKEDGKDVVLARGTLAMTPGSDAEGRVVLLRDLAELAGQKLQIGFEAATLLDEGTPFGFDLNGPEEKGFRVELGVDGSQQSKVSVLLPDGTVLAEKQVSLEGPIIQVSAVLDLSDAGQSPQIELIVQGKSLGPFEVPQLNSPVQFQLFGAPKTDEIFYFDDLSIRQL